MRLIGVEAGGEGVNTTKHAATLTKGSPGVLHGSYSYLLQASGRFLVIYEQYVFLPATKCQKNRAHAQCTCAVQMHGPAVPAAAVQPHNHPKQPTWNSAPQNAVPQDADGQIIDPHSISAGLDYPGIGPEHSFLKDASRAEYHAVTDAQARRTALYFLLWLAFLSLY